MGPRLSKEASARLRALVRGTVTARRVKSVTALADLVGVSPTSLYLFLRGGGLSEVVATEVARACGVELGELVARETARVDAGQWDAVPARKPRQVPAPGPEFEPLPLHPSRFYVARLIEPFALLDYVPDGLDLADVLRAESAYRQARAIPPGIATRQWLTVHGRLNRRAPEND